MSGFFDSFSVFPCQLNSLRPKLRKNPSCLDSPEQDVPELDAGDLELPEGGEHERGSTRERRALQALLVEEGNQFSERQMKWLVKVGFYT